MKNYPILKTVVVFVVSILVSIVSLNVSAQTYVVVVNSENTYSASEEEMKQLVRRVFLKETHSWPGGIKTKPFNHKDDVVYQKFIVDILGMDARKIEEYWLGKKQKTGETPPRLGPEKLLGKLVAKSPGGVAYMQKSTAEGIDGVRIIFEF